MPPTGGETGNRNGLEIAFDSSTGFKLPNGSDNSPDAAWIPREK